LGLGVEVSCEICSLRLFYMEKVLGQIFEEVWEEGVYCHSLMV
jgi:hypothetical protein